MAPRSPLGDLDPLGVPLPHGTEVTTRVDKLHEGRRIPQGVMGRIVRARDGGFDVQVAATGEVFYLREELLPRRPGQVQFARRRAAAWDALLPCVVLEATVGSRAWGLADEGSDLDTRGVFALPHSWTTGLGEPPRDLVSADGSTTYWELRKAVEQGLRADPNTLELLFLPGARALDPLGEWLLQGRDAFVSRELFGSFGRYAVSQLRKLARAHNLALHQADVLRWLCDEPAPGLDEVALRLARLAPRAGQDEAAGALAAKEYVKQLYRSLHDQGLLAANDFASLQRYARAGGTRPPEARELRPKNAYNLLRLIVTATGWLRTGTPQFAATGAHRERLLQIKRGEVALDEVLAEAESLVPGLEAARDASPLPERPDYARADRLLRRAGAELARRSVLQLPGPLGADAPPPPAFEGEGR
jgi:hypothetical protein